jgi:hypothetical protein
MPTAPPPRAHFIALSTYAGLPALAPPHAALFCDVLAGFRERLGFRLHAYVVLPVRAGLVVATADGDPRSVRLLARGLTARYARELHTRSGWPGRIFRDPVGVAGVPTAAAIARRAAALHRLPVLSGLAPRPSAWPWSSAGAWTGRGLPPAPVDLPEEAVGGPPGAVGSSEFGGALSG